MLHRGPEGFTSCERSRNVCFVHHSSQLAEAGSTNSKPPENGFSIGDLWSRVALLITHVPGPLSYLLASQVVNVQSLRAAAVDG